MHARTAKSKVMHHIIHVSMNAETLRQLDELRETYPDAADRGQILRTLIHEASARREAARNTPSHIDFANLMRVALEAQRRSRSRCQ